MQDICVWAPPFLSHSCLAEKMREWIVHNPTKPPYIAFLQDCVSSHWPAMWHLKTQYLFVVNMKMRTITYDETDATAAATCAICRNGLTSGTEDLPCGHKFHTMCIHRWLRCKNTCPMCRSNVDK